MKPVSELPLVLAPAIKPQSFTDAAKAVDALIAAYDTATHWLRTQFDAIMSDTPPAGKYRAYYPEISLSVVSYAKVDSRLSFGHVSEPGRYATNITRPDLFRHYLTEQLDLLIKNHGVTIELGTSSTPIPLHFAMAENTRVEGSIEDHLDRPLRDIFDVPDLSVTNDDIVNGTNKLPEDGTRPLSLFTAQRIDYSLARLTHYTATSPVWFQNHVLFTNYQFYMDEFEAFGRAQVADPNSGYTKFIASGNVITDANGTTGTAPAKTPQMPTFHLVREDGSGISLVNIGVGPSNAKTITDHIAVLRPHAWIMVGHCAGLRNSQSLGDYVLAHAYIREDNVLDADLPSWVPIPALAEIQVALESSLAEVTTLTGFELKKIMRTGTVASMDNRNWELRDQSGPVQNLSLSRAIGLDMESATIAANGFRFRVPYGTLLCISDKPLHGELKLPGMATAFYNRQVSQHLAIGVRAMELLRDMPLERLHSRKLRSFDETAFL